MKNQITWNKKRPATDFTIAKNGFNTVLSKHNQARFTRARIRKIYSGVVVTSIIACSALFHFQVLSPEENNRYEPITKEVPIEITLPTPISYHPVDINEPIKKEMGLDESPGQYQVQAEEKTDQNSNANKTQKTKNHTDSKPFTQFVNASPKDGFNSFNLLLQSKMDSLLVANDSVINHKINIHFEVAATGKISKVNIKNLEVPQLNAQINHIMEEMPFWHPAKANEVPIVSRFVIPIQLVYKAKF